MKYSIRFIALMLAALMWCGASAQKPEKVIVGYVTSWSDVMPDPAYLTHINYAFGGVNKTFDGVEVSNPDRLRAIVALKQQAPDLKVMLSVGGWGSGGFSEMSSTEARRKAFADDCLRVVKEFGIDGIDIDWEYPGSSSSGIASSPDDKDNFPLLMRRLRETLGPDRLLTFASVWNGDYVDFRAVTPYLDFVNLMTYDMANAPYHHAPLYASENTAGNSVDEGVKAHLAAGVPASKIVLGVPFYGRGGGEVRGMNYRQIAAGDHGYGLVYDHIACEPLVVDKDGTVLMGYDDPHSLAVKCDYILANDLRGAMYWEYSGDDDNLSLNKTLASALKGKSGKRHLLVISEGGGQHGPFTERAMRWLHGYADTHNLAITELRNANPITKSYLEDYDAVVQLDFPPYTWPEEAQAAFTDYIDNGRGGWVGFHHATLLGDFDGYPMWRWFSDFMGGITFRNYIAGLADGTVTVENQGHPVMAGLPDTFVLPADEWYTYDVSPRPNVQVLASVDENSYVPASDIRMGDHPVVWTNNSKKARNVYFQPGHSPRLFESESFRTMLANALGWVLNQD